MFTSTFKGEVADLIAGLKVMPVSVVPSASNSKVLDLNGRVCRETGQAQRTKQAAVLDLGFFKVA